MVQFFPATSGRNIKIKGRYTYYDAKTNSYAFPYFNSYYQEGARTNYDEPNLHGGWVSFRIGKLVDGDFETATGFPYYPTGLNGHDIEFDLGKEYHIDTIEFIAHSEHLRNVKVFLKSPEEKHWTKAHVVADRVWLTKGLPPLLPNDFFIKIGSKARWIRLNTLSKSIFYGGFREIRIWGEPIEEGTESKGKKLAYSQNEGKRVIKNPKEIPLNTINSLATSIWPIPKEIKQFKGKFDMDEQTKIVLNQKSSERTYRTAKVLQRDILDEHGLNLDIVKLNDHKISIEKNIIVLEHISNTHEDVEIIKTHGYYLKINSRKISIAGRDDKGLFYGTQSLMQMIQEGRPYLYIPCAKVLDWPDKQHRIIGAIQSPSKDFIKAMSRYKVSSIYVDTINYDLARKNSKYAEDRFLEFTIYFIFQWLYGADKDALVERRVGEPLKKIGNERRITCPSHPLTWEIFDKKIESFKGIYGSMVDIHLDELEKPDFGSRWNVCQRCRKREMTAQNLWVDTLEKIHSRLSKIGKNKILFSDTMVSYKGLSHKDDEKCDWRKIPELLARRGLLNHFMVWNWHYKSSVTKRLSQLGMDQVIYLRAAPSERLPNEAKGIVLSGGGVFNLSYSLGISQAAWSPKKGLLGSEVYDKSIAKAISMAHQLIKGKLFPSSNLNAEFFNIDLSNVVNRSFVDQVPSDGKGFCDFGPNYDLRAMKSGHRVFRHVPYKILSGERNCVMVQNRKYFDKAHPSKIEIPVNKKAASIRFLHTLDSRNSHGYIVRRELVGYYYMVYEDGTYDPLEIKYGINICNFDGLNSHWGWNYAPSGEIMPKADLVWKGEMGAGVEAHLYSTEWVNPNPSKKIKKIIFSSTWKPIGTNPILIAATGVIPTQKDLASQDLGPTKYYDKKSGMTLSEVYTEKRISKILPVGKKIDLQDGQSISDYLWKTRSGITLEYQGQLKNVESKYRFHYWSRVALALYDNNRWPRGEGYYILTFPKNRKLEGVLLTGSYRFESSSSDFLPENLNIELYTTIDGKEWKEHVIDRKMYTPEEEGPIWLALKGLNVKALKLRVKNRGHFANVNHLRPGISYLEVYEKQ